MLLCDLHCSLLIVPLQTSVLEPRVTLAPDQWRFGEQCPLVSLRPLPLPENAPYEVHFMPTGSDQLNTASNVTFQPGSSTLSFSPPPHPGVPRSDRLFLNEKPTLLFFRYVRDGNPNDATPVAQSTVKMMNFLIMFCAAMLWVLFILLVVKIAAATTIAKTIPTPTRIPIGIECVQSG